MIQIRLSNRTIQLLVSPHTTVTRMSIYEQADNEALTEIGLRTGKRKTLDRSQNKYDHASGLYGTNQNQHDNGGYSGQATGAYAERNETVNRMLRAVKSPSAIDLKPEPIEAVLPTVSRT